MPFTIEEGRAAVALARDTLEAHVKGNRLAPHRGLAIFNEKRGVFVTLNKEESGTRSLRGCIGYPEPIKPLGEAIEDVTVFACEDPRFPYAVVPEELGSIVVEVSILTLPRDLIVPRRRDIPSKIRLGIDGLIVSNAYASGLFLPQVATEFGLDSTEFLSQTCLKAGLPPDAWLDNDTKVQVFQAEIFVEARPHGEVSRVTPRGR